MDYKPIKLRHVQYICVRVCAIQALHEQKGANSSEEGSYLVNESLQYLMVYAVCVV